MKILVTGGTGRVGSEVVKELQKRKADIRLLVRKSDAPTPAGVEAAIGDLLDPVSVEKAMAGVDKLYLLNAVLPDELTQGLIAYDLAKKLKLSHVVYHSVFRVEHFKDVPHFASKLAIESALREFDVPFTIIRPNYFIQNDATLKDRLRGLASTPCLSDKRASPQSTSGISPKPPRLRLPPTDISEKPTTSTVQRL
jgi:uncharacterized protein YbjT (DUF2867 family)